MATADRPSDGENARDVIAGALEQFLARSTFGALVLADDAAAPPMLAYLTHFPRLTVVLSGCQTMTVGRHGMLVTVRPVAGDAIYVPANCWNLPDWSEPVCGITFLFGRRHTGVSLVHHPGGGPEVAPRTTKTSLNHDTSPTLQHLLDALSLAAGEALHDRDRAASAEGLARACVTAVLYASFRLLVAPPPRRDHAHGLCDLIRLYIQENAHLPITRERVAAHFGLSPNHISRLFRLNGGLGFNRTLNAARVDRAKLMLGQYGTPLKEIAQHCGFSTPAYFCHTFKSLTNRTPSEYRLESLRTTRA